ncbi:hypothetical protein C0585_07240 [Candidatus Woesearchaeota archaeon]|nr:MAG: hypothetical protein C0585_07240 [Candidatus Woesearchaeota archaeon]
MSYFPSPGDSMKIIEPGFKIILGWIQNDYVRTFVMIVLLSVFLIRLIQASLSKTPLASNANKIAVPLGLIATLGAVYKFKTSLDQFSWLIFVVAMIALIAPYIKKLGFSGFWSRQGKYGDYSNERRTIRRDRRTVNDERHEQRRAERETRREANRTEDENDSVRSITNTPDESRILEELQRALRESGRQ